MTNELYHAGVKGMKWGVRKNKPASSGISRNSRKTSNANDIDRTPQKKTKMSSRLKRGKSVVSAVESMDTRKLISNSAAVASGALRVAAAFIPGAGALSGVAHATALLGTVASITAKP